MCKIISKSGIKFSIWNKKGWNGTFETFEKYKDDKYLQLIKENEIRKENKKKKDFDFIHNFINQDKYVKVSPNLTMKDKKTEEIKKIFNFQIPFKKLFREFSSHILNKNKNKSHNENFYHCSKSKFKKILKKSFKNYKFSKLGSDICRKCFIYYNLKNPTELQQKIFSQHYFHSHCTREKFNEQKKNVPEDTILILFDYKSNTNLLSGGNEVNQIFFNKPQLICFGVCAYFKEGNEIKKK